MEVTLSFDFKQFFSRTENPLRLFVSVYSTFNAQHDTTMVKVLLCEAAM